MTNPHCTLFRRPSGTYYSLSDGTVWQWYVRVLIFPGCFQGFYVRRRALKNRLPIDAVYASNPPADLLTAMRRVGDSVHHYDLHRGQEHVKA
ncbi:MAG: hypothetical protein O2782_03800 [bacterium]|nr:hypothetical protein [bacterium]